MSTRTNRSRVIYIIGLAILMVSGFTAFTMAGDGKPALYATWVSILPPVVAIGLALITKEVYSSLFLGVLQELCCTQDRVSRESLTGCSMTES